VIGEIREPDSCLKVELRRPRFSKGSRGSTYNLVGELCNFLLKSLFHW